MSESFLELMPKDWEKIHQIELVDIHIDPNLPEPPDFLITRQRLDQLEKNQRNFNFNKDPVNREKCKQKPHDMPIEEWDNLIEDWDKIFDDARKFDLPNPEKLCASCLKFDKQFENGNVRIDILTVCECDEELTESTCNEPKCDETTQTTSEDK